jgi:hypothetical protein
MSLSFILITLPQAAMTLSSPPFAITVANRTWLRRRGYAWARAFLLVAGATAVALTMTACGGSSNPFAMTPGTYSYAMTAQDESTGAAPLGQAVSTIFTITIPQSR